MLFKKIPGKPLYCQEEIEGKYEDILMGFSLEYISSRTTIFLGISSKRQWILDILNSPRRTDWMDLTKEDHELVRKYGSGCPCTSIWKRNLLLLISMTKIVY